jgi:7,8-dihydropterin-6-yl-methyl-4-(beta-D-ribofuranosyl)aminobenzene 5'-phosphate synthase
MNRNPSRPPKHHERLVQLKALEVVMAISHIHSFSLECDIQMIGGRKLNIEVAIIYDNNWGRADLKPSWGFSSFVKTAEKTILFDTGGDSAILLDNIKRMGLDPAKIDVIILSHLYDDHAGGLLGLLKVNSRMDIYLPYLSNQIEENLGMCAGKIAQVRDYQEISPGTLVVAQGDNQSLVLDGKDGLIMLASCTPKKVLKMIEKVKKLKKREIHLLIAAFCLHTLGKMEKMADSFRALGARKIIPCHCCGEPSRRILRERFREDYVEVGVGSIIRI